MDSRTPAPHANDYKAEAKPVWCPGCGHYSVLAALTRALAALALPRHEVAVVSGIGCSSRMPAYTSVYGFHSVHGRALAVATGLKLARPELTVIVAGGDGDGFSIGGNHFLHACRRNVDLTYIVMDNEVYGMTKGQASPTTACDWTGSKLTPEGPGVTPIDPIQLALACGANFVARGFSGDPNTLAHMIADGVRHPGFSVIQALSPCVTFRPEQKDWKKLVHAAQHDSATDPRRASHLALEDDPFTTGVFLTGTRPAFPPADVVRSIKKTVAELEQEFVA